MSAGNSTSQASSQSEDAFVPQIMEMTKLAFPPGPFEWMGAFALLIIFMVANAGGLGGGGTLIPFYMLFFGLPIQECVPIANLFGLIPGLLRFLINFNQKHPINTFRLALDYEIIMLTMPLLYLGTLIGVRIGTILSPIQLAIALFIVMGFVAFKTIQKAISMFRQENAERRRLKEIQLVTISVDFELEEEKGIKKIQNSSPLRDVQEHFDIDEDEYRNRSRGSQEKQSFQKIQHLVENLGADHSQIIDTPELRQIMENEAKNFSFRRTTQILATLTLLFGTQMLITSKYSKSVIIAPIYQLMLFLFFLAYTVTLTIFNAKEIKRIHIIKKRDNYPYDKQDYMFLSNAAIIKMIIICFAAGTIGGVVGIAGGLILAPVFLSLGLNPTVVAGTNQYLALISTISVTTQFISMGILNYEYALFIGLFVAVGSAVGITQVKKLVKYTGRQSVIVITLGIVLALSFSFLPLKFVSFFG